MSTLTFTDFDSMENLNPAGVIKSPVNVSVAFSSSLTCFGLAPDVTPTRANGSPNRFVRIFASSSSARLPLLFELILFFICPPFQSVRIIGVSANAIPLIKCSLSMSHFRSL